MVTYKQIEHTIFKGIFCEVCFIVDLRKLELMIRFNCDCQD